MNTRTGSQCTSIVSSLLKVLPLILTVQQPPRTNMWSNPLTVIKQLHDLLTYKSEWV